MFLHVSIISAERLSVANLGILGHGSWLIGPNIPQKVAHGLWKSDHQALVGSTDAEAAGGSP